MITLTGKPASIAIGMMISLRTWSEHLSMSVDPPAKGDAHTSAYSVFRLRM